MLGTIWNWEEIFKKKINDKTDHTLKLYNILDKKITFHSTPTEKFLCNDYALMTLKIYLKFHYTRKIKCKKNIQLFPVKLVINKCLTTTSKCLTSTPVRSIKLKKLLRKRDSKTKYECTSKIHTMTMNYD